MTTASMEIATIEASDRVVETVGRDRLRDLRRRSDEPGLVFQFGHLGPLARTGTLLWNTLLG